MYTWTLVEVYPYVNAEFTIFTTVAILRLSVIQVKLSAVIPGSKVLIVDKLVIEDIQLLARVESANDCSYKNVWKTNIRVKIIYNSNIYIYIYT